MKRQQEISYQLDLFLGKHTVMSMFVYYLENNKERIRYGEFKKRGYLIGSGAIEAAHREVIQKR